MSMSHVNGHVMQPHSIHAAQCYRSDEAALVQNAARFLGDGLGFGRSLVIIATPSHRIALVNELKRIGALSKPDSFGRLLLLDAGDTLARLQIAGEPDARRFDETVGATIREVMDRNRTRGVCAFGEMVGELWKAKRYTAAARLEELWNDLRASIDLDLFCAYPFDIFSEPFDAKASAALLNEHTHLMSDASSGLMGSALHEAFGEIVGTSAGTLTDQVSAFQQPGWASMPATEATIVWLWHTMPDRAPAILELARRYAALT
jgi:hypothetical protein